MVFAIGGGVLFGALAYLVRTNSDLIGIDNGVAKWGNRHASAWSMHALNDVTQLGSIYAVIVLCVILAVAETIRERSVWVVPFIVAVMGGEEILTTTVKQLADRVRPDLQPRRGDARAVVPERPLGDSGRLLRHCGASARSVARTPGASGRSRVSRWESPSRSPRVACCSTCIGCQT